MKKEISIQSITTTTAPAILPHRGQADTVSKPAPSGLGSGDDIARRISEKNWQDFAKCRGMDIRMFFPVRTDPPTVVAQAKRVCNGCPVKKRCLLIALESNPDNWGVFGGTTARTRRIIRREVTRDPDYLSSPEAQELYGLTDAY